MDYLDQHKYHKKITNLLRYVKERWLYYVSVCSYGMFGVTMELAYILGGQALVSPGFSSPRHITSSSLSSIVTGFSGVPFWSTGLEGDGFCGDITGGITLVTFPGRLKTRKSEINVYFHSKGYELDNFTI